LQFVFILPYRTAVMIAGPGAFIQDQCFSDITEELTVEPSKELSTKCTILLQR